MGTHAGVGHVLLVLAWAAGTAWLPPVRAWGLDVSVDADRDGWVDAVETSLGSSPANPASTPEDVAAPPSCLDGLDNDGDGATDLADPGCAPPTVVKDAFPPAGVDRFDSNLTLDAYPLATTLFGTCTVDFSGRGPVAVQRSAPATGAFDTEILAMQLTGTATVAAGGTCTIPPGDYPVTMFEDPAKTSTGRVTSTGATDFPADSFFDVFFELDTPVGVLAGGPPNGPVGDAVRVQNTIQSLPPYNTAENPNCYTVQGLAHKHCPKAPPDHFKCYQARFPKVQKRTVTLEDQFGQSESVVAKPLYFCNPASKNAEPLYQEASHLTCYVTRPKANRKQDEDHDVTVRNQFGQERVRVKKVRGERLLCLPSKKDQLPEPVAADHFKCYAGKFPKFTPRDVTLVDQFLTDETRVLKPVLLCNPVSKNGEGINDRLNHLKCYKIKPRQVRKTVTVVNQFVPEGMTVAIKRSELLCVPSTKVENDGSTTTTTVVTTTTSTTICTQPPCTGRSAGTTCLGRIQLQGPSACVEGADTGCDAYHLHGLFLLDGQPVNDPNPTGCGHGKIGADPACAGLTDAVPACP
ncbi:MAG: hypothetical protein U0807_06255 [Candidatus Binatia bacterium]